MFCIPLLFYCRFLLWSHLDISNVLKETPPAHRCIWITYSIYWLQCIHCCRSCLKLEIHVNFHHFGYLGESVLFQIKSCRLQDSAKTCIKTYCIVPRGTHKHFNLLTVKDSTVWDPTMEMCIYDMQKYPYPRLCTRKCGNCLCYDGGWKNSSTSQHRHCIKKNPKQLPRFGRCSVIKMKPAWLW